MRRVAVAGAFGATLAVLAGTPSTANIDNARSMCFFAKLAGKVTSCNVERAAETVHVGLPISVEKAQMVCPTFKERLASNGFVFDAGWVINVIPGDQNDKAVTCAPF
ncbi:MAG: hypothetical protein AAGE80_13390 [Pseudomonadota bacterium]